MGNVIIQKETTLDPISLIGYEAGVCWGANTSNSEKNYKRGLDCLVSGHGRTWEFPQVYMILDGYSARVIREFYTHIGGSPTRLQASTRYIDYQKGFNYVIPSSIYNNDEANKIYVNLMSQILLSMQSMEELNIPREDIGMVLPLCMETKIVVRTNLRNLIDMSHQRLCSRAYTEFRALMKNLMQSLSEYSPEWEYLIKHYFVPKCDLTGSCSEVRSCGRKPKSDSMEHI